MCPNTLVWKISGGEGAHVKHPKKNKKKKQFAHAIQLLAKDSPHADLQEWTPNFGLDVSYLIYLPEIKDEICSHINSWLKTMSNGSYTCKLPLTIIYFKSHKTFDRAVITPSLQKTKNI